MKKRIIAVDGPAGSGKSVLKIVARELGFEYLGTGAIFRSATALIIDERLPISDHKSVVKFAQCNIPQRIKHVGTLLTMDGCDPGERLQDPEVDKLTPLIAQIPEIRELVRTIQRSFAEKYDTVAEGRDLTSEVFPDADLKIYMDARLRIRASRRWKQYLVDGRYGARLIDVIMEIKSRDYEDIERTFCPLKRTFDSHYLDTTDMTKDRVVSRILSLWSRNNNLD